MNTVEFRVKALDTGDPNGSFEAILSTPTRDREGEIVAPGAFLPLPKSIPLHHAHDWVDKALPIGSAEPFYDGDTLKIRGTFDSSAKAQEVRRLVNNGLLHSMSAGFIRAKRKGNTVTSAELVEGSFTALPVNPDALVLSAKSFLPPPSRVESIRRSLAFGMAALAGNGGTKALRRKGPDISPGVIRHGGSSYVQGYGYGGRPGDNRPIPCRTEVQPLSAHVLPRDERTAPRTPFSYPSLSVIEEPESQYLPIEERTSPRTPYCDVA